ncbi:hypothetical protein UFOVP748_32 [uncultured Caudovirales phage]|uniref:Uncharacterized protein n=1 Tax=uncultured Caudovirales phage TaxID=2100421 RepID=A0A6J5NEG2_9CAUD|nr:hypothetical protein UFOVP680_21 [uncultured Caudovirales phage]CAB5225529.1 hypothetical protein UFOVP748_32 [uncultured Caudovirales phage]
MPRDKLLHLALGVIAMLCALPALVYYEVMGLGACLAYTTSMVGLLYEGQQWVREEGQVEWLDALATAAPGWIAWGVLAIVQTVR